MYADKTAPASLTWLRDAIVQKYRSGVRVGNWFEDTVVAQHEIDTLRWRHDNGGLFFQLIEQTHSRFHEEIHFAEEAMGDGFVRFGAVVNVIATGLPVDGSGCGTWALAVSLAEDFASSAKDITNDKCHLALAAVAFSCARNTFRIVSTDEHDRTNEILKYNQHFQLELVQCPADRQMVVHSSIKCGAALNVAHSPHTFYCNGEANLSIGLGVKTHVPKVQTRWKCLYRAPEDRFENEGEPVKLNHDLGILHVASNRLLAAEPTWANSAFGMEFGVSATTYRDVYGNETFQNVWRFQNLRIENKN